MLALVAAAAWVLRFIPLTRAAGVFDYPVDYSEGVSFAASALFFQGHWPYRDFTFVHPPGGVWLWGPAAGASLWLGADTAFAVARWMATFCGALNVFLAGRLALRVWGPVAGLVAALVYASYPEAVLFERGPFLEPVLNLACLAAANAWLVPRHEEDEEPRWLLAGVLLGVALSVKVLAGIWLLAALVAHPPGPSWKGFVGVILTAVGTVALLVGPFVLTAPSEFFSQVLLFPALRPGDGVLNEMGRLHELFHERRLVGGGLALLGLVLIATRAFRDAEPSRPAERFFAVVYVLTVFAFLSAPSYWYQDNVFLAASSSVLAGVGAAALHEWLVDWRPHLSRYGVALLAVAVLLPTYRNLHAGNRRKAPEQMALGQYLRQAVPPEASLFTFEPAWVIVAGRLPAAAPGVPLVVDSYAVMLQGAMASGREFAHVKEAFQTQASQAVIRQVLEQSRFVVLGWRGTWQLSQESQQWFRSRFIRRFPAEGREGLELWEQLPR